MARTVDLLVGTDEPLSAVTAAVEQALGGAFTNPGTDDALAHLTHDSTNIHAGTHHFDHGDLQAPDGTPLELHSQYTTEWRSATWTAARFASSPPPPALRGIEGHRELESRARRWPAEGDRHLRACQVRLGGHLTNGSKLA
jgi:hypothetical protein